MVSRDPGNFRKVLENDG